MCFGDDEDEQRLERARRKSAKQFCYQDYEMLGKKGPHGKPKTPNTSRTLKNEYDEDEFTEVYFCPSCKPLADQGIY